MDNWWIIAAALTFAFTVGVVVGITHGYRLGQKRRGAGEYNRL